jgi:DNA-binding MarR family transcriptional regulator
VSTNTLISDSILPAPSVSPMPQFQKEAVAVELLTEVSILGAVISARIDNEAPEGLTEIRLSILMILARHDQIGMARSAMIWMLEDKAPNIVEDLAYVIDAGLVKVAAGAASRAHDMLHLTPAGNAQKDNAIRALMPKFEPAIEDVTAEAMEQAMLTLREIRRTLDNLPE